MDFLTKIWVIEEDELLPAVLRHHLQDDLVKVDRWADHQGVVVCSGQATGQRAGGAGRPSRRALDEEVGDVHGVCQRLKAACWHAADGTDQRQDTTIHQFAGWREKGGAERKDRSCYSQNTRGIVYTNTACLCTAPAPEVYHYLWAKNAPRKVILVPQISTRVKSKEEDGGRTGVFVISRFYLLFILKSFYALTTNKYGKKWNSDFILWINSIFYEVESRRLHHLQEFCKPGII